jgi:hypothetical protein
MPSKLRIQIKDKVYEATCDSIHRVYINHFSKERLSIGQTIEFIRKNDEYYFTVK